MNLFLLSAGLGTRLRPYTESVPKPAVPFMTVPLACYPLSLFEDQKIENLVVNTHHLPEKIKSLFEQIHWPCKKLIFSNEEKKILGSGGGIRQALPNLLGRQNFCVANADEVILPFHHAVMKEAFKFHHFHKGLATILTIQHPEVGKKYGGLWLKQSSKVECFSKISVAGHRGLHYIGVMILNDRISKYFKTEEDQEENLLYETLTKAMEMGEEVHAFEIEAQWFETGNAKDFLDGTEACLQALRQPQREPWAEYLLQVMCRNGGRDMLIENDRPMLKKLLLEQIPKWLAGN